MPNAMTGKRRQPIWPLVLVVVLAGIIVAALPMLAQSGRGTVSGVVIAADGAPVASAEVFFQPGDGEAPHVLRTDAGGRFHSRPLRAGLYDVRAEAAGKWSEWSRNVVVRTGSDPNLTLRLVRSAQPGR